MRRTDFEHVIRAAADIVDDEVVVIGSQAILGSHPDAPASLLTSLELDLYPRHKPERSGDIDGNLGDGSRFHETFGYYAQGVGRETAKAPTGWEDRLIRIEVPAATRRKPPAVAWCLEPHDLVLSKLAAGRPHDLLFAETAIREDLVDAGELLRRSDLMPKQYRQTTSERLTGLIKRIRASSNAG